MDEAIETECEHGELWLARDGQWYCAMCEPPVEAFNEVVERRQREEVMRLFADDYNQAA